MLTAQELDQRYRQTTEKTLLGWRTQPGTGALLQQPRYAMDKYALATGITPEPSAAIRATIADLHQLSQGDPLADPIPFSALHFTFLPVTRALYAAPALTENIADLLQAYRAISPLQVRLTQLRLVALPGQLLLAGIPDAQSLAMREQFTRDLLASSWREELQKRNQQTALPPPFWHSTLLRYQAEQLPTRFRDFFLSSQPIYSEPVEAPLRLVITNYNWSAARDLADA